MFRFIITGLFEPFLHYVLYQCAMHDYFEFRSYFRRSIPPWWNTVLSVELCNKAKDDMNQIHFNTKRFRRRIVTLFATDLSLLICFGALFPPLAVIIALSVLKDVMSIRLALGRYCEIMEAVQDESLKEQMVKVKESMDEEMLKAGAGIWNGVWYGMVISTWIWGFVLFDTMASVEGVWKGLYVVIGMVCCPFLFNFFLQIEIRHKRDTKQGETLMLDLNYMEGYDVNMSTTSNPILNRDRLIEMVSINLKSEHVSGKLK
jgi:hypothetical protein